MKKTLLLTALAATTALALLLATASVRADEHRSRAATAPAPKVYAQECGACHTAYPAGLLPAASWQRLVAGLDKHFGADAALDAAARKPIEAWLAANAATAQQAAPPQDRITRTAWFERKHRKIDAPVWKLPSVKSAANCQACHGGAEQGNFSEHDLTTPAGLTLWQRRAFID